MLKFTTYISISKYSINLSKQKTEIIVNLKLATWDEMNTIISYFILFYSIIFFHFKGLK